jgi:molybdenum cofactor synthesis domain-containing protein
MRVAVLTISDRSASGERDDKTGPALVERLQREGWEVLRTDVVSDDPEAIAKVLIDWSDAFEFDLILTAGGTGFSARDRAPEATREIVERLAPGISEAMRAGSLKITPHAMLSRAIAGIRARTLIVNLPGSPRAAIENVEIIIPSLPHAVKLLQEDPQAEDGHRWTPRQHRA